MNLEIYNAITSKLIDEWEEVSWANNLYVIELHMKVTFVIARLDFVTMHCINFSSRNEGDARCPIGI